MSPWTWQLLRAGSFRLDGGGMFGVIPKTIWSKLAAADHNNRIGLQTNCLLLDNGEVKVLIETGFGDKWTDKERGFWDLERRTIVDALREKGVEPDQINHVVVTHLHFDHAAGLTAMNPAGIAVPTFPRADIFVQKTEWGDALENKSTMHRTYLRSHLDPIAQRVKLIDGEREILEGITVFPMLGHTWGQQAVRFQDQRGTVCFPGDVMPTVHHVGPAYSLGYDMLPYHSMISKHRLLQTAAEDHWRLALDHEPGQAVVGVQRDRERDDRFVLTPA
ncbi:MAG: MBL fold metallo-hydrolase [Phycisphaerales bacterium]|nr:MBL fold metallo-hydrolase [Phycisphaerales bacterium]MCI0631916.1 MBL fold metallo-hydrolase [Phycisphaerales bacterium]